MSKLNEDTIKALKIAGIAVTEGLNKKELNSYTFELFGRVTLIASSEEVALTRLRGIFNDFNTDNNHNGYLDWELSDSDDHE